MTTNDNPYRHDSECTEACPACRWRMGEMKKQLDSPTPDSSPKPSLSPSPSCGEWYCRHWSGLPMEQLHSTAGWHHTCENINEPCIACCGTVEAYQEACGVPPELRGVVPPKPRTK